MEKINALRDRIDKIDEEILHLLKERMEISKTIGRIKRGQGAPIRDPQRENEKYSILKEKAVELGLNPEDVNEIFRKIVEMSIRIQQQT